MSTPKQEVVTQSTEIAEQNVTPLQAVPTPENVSPLVAMLASGELKAENVEQAMALQEKHDNYQAKKAYHKAMANFRRELKPAKRSGVNHHLKTKYSTFDDCMEAANEPLGNNGINVDFKKDVDLEKGIMTYTCRLTHELGHSEESTMPAFIEKQNGINGLQQLGLTASYLKRYTLCDVTGMPTEDSDGEGASTKPNKGEPQQQQKPPKQYDVAPLVKAIDDKDGFAIIDIMADLDADGQTEIFNGFKKGEIHKRKEKARAFMGAAHKQIKDALKQLDEHMKNDDEHGALEVLEETKIKYITPRASTELNAWLNGDK